MHLGYSMPSKRCSTGSLQEPTQHQKHQPPRFGKKLSPHTRKAFKSVPASRAWLSALILEKKFARKCCIGKICQADAKWFHSLLLPLIVSFNWKKFWRYFQH